MTNLLKSKCNVINWTIECDLSFQTLKLVSTQIHVLTIIDALNDNVIVCADASNLAIDTVLMQDKR